MIKNIGRSTGNFLLLCATYPSSIVSYQLRSLVSTLITPDSPFLILWIISQLIHRRRICIFCSRPIVFQQIKYRHQSQNNRTRKIGLNEWRACVNEGTTAVSCMIKHRVYIRRRRRKHVSGTLSLWFKIGSYCWRSSS